MKLSASEGAAVAVRIVVAEDQRMVRELLVALLDREEGFDVVAQASTGREAIEAVQATAPDVLVLDVGLPDMDGVEVAAAVRSSRPQMRIVAVSIHSDRRFVRLMLQSGVHGYVAKSAAVAELVAAIRAVMQGKGYLSPMLALRLEPGDSARETRLGARERQVLALLAEGKRSAQIARQLRISVATVEVHRRNIMRKLDLHSVAELTRYAIREGLSPLGSKSPGHD